MKKTPKKHQTNIPNVCGSFCPDCKNTGWKLRSDGKIPVDETIGIQPEMRFESLPISETMIKCICGQKQRKINK